jgi:hypothetical protein
MVSNIVTVQVIEPNLDIICSWTRVGVLVDDDNDSKEELDLLYKISGPLVYHTILAQSILKR